VAADAYVFPICARAARIWSTLAFRAAKLGPHLSAQFGGLLKRRLESSLDDARQVLDQG